MRNSGIRSECITMRPHDHIGWVFDDAEGFDAIAMPFLAAGAARGEQIFYIAADPGPSVTSRLAALAPHGAHTASIAEVYGSSGVIDPQAVLAFFTSVFLNVLSDGYSGLRVAADNTPLVTGDAGLTAWYQWEMMADRFMAQNSASALCAFNGSKVDVNRLRHLATLHPLSSDSSPRPQFRMFADQDGLRLEGQIDSYAISQIPLALEVLPPETTVLVDLTRSRLTHALAADLRNLRDAGVPVTIHGAALEDLDALAAANLTPGGEHLIIQPQPLG
jgi:MEDS: MEthanogen/methylotroph, DcmR Sensory domain